MIDSYNMRRTPCEYTIWNGIPNIRKELAEILIQQYGLSQREVAEKLGITPSAVCQYHSKKRGKKDFFDDEILKEIKISAEHIMNNDSTDVIIETCRICRLVQKNKHFLAIFEEFQNRKE